VGGAGSVTLVSIHPEPNAKTGKKIVKAQTFRWPAEADAAMTWVAGMNRASNVYFAVNQTREMRTKPCKADVTRILGIHADVDPVEDRPLAGERSRLRSIADELAERPEPPTFVIDSGGGIQIFYRAEYEAEPLLGFIAEAEAYSRRLECVAGGKENCSNVDRVMRVPGTVNHPDAKKRRAGRVPTLATILSASGRVYTWPQISDEIVKLEDEPPAAAEPVAFKPKVNGHARGDSGGDLPPYATDAELEALFANFPHMEAIWRGTSPFPPPDDSPSGWDYHWVAELVRVGFHDRDALASFLRAFRAHVEDSQPAAERRHKDERPDYIWGTVREALANNYSPQDRAAQPEDDVGGQAQAGTPPPGGERQTAGNPKTGKNRGTFKDPNAKSAPPAWPDPGTLGEPPPAPRFPTAHLPGALRLWVEQQAANMGVPADILAVPALVCVAGAIGKNAVLRPKRNDPSWTERPCLWAAIIMPKGSLKSPALRIATKPLIIAEARARERWRPLHDEWKARQKAKAKSKSNGPEEADPEPPEPKLVLTNATIEAAAAAMEHSRGLTLIKDELSGTVDNMARYHSKGSDRAFYLECHSGGHYAVDRIMRGRQILTDIFMNIVGGIQPPVAKRVFAAAANREDDGFMERFGLICYPDPVPWTGVRDVAPERDYRQLVTEACERLAEKDWRLLMCSDLRNAFQRDGFMHFDQEAQSRFFAWYDHHMRTRVRAPGIEDKPEHGFWSKGQGLVLRLTIVVHLYRWTTMDGVYEQTMIDTRSLEAAIGIFEQYCLPMYSRVCAAFGQVQAHDGARRVAELIRRKKLALIRVGDVTKLHWHGLRERAPIVAAFEALEDVDWLRRADPPGRRTGKPADHWLVNPRVHQ
jgi:hypothetical protein